MKELKGLIDHRNSELWNSLSKVQKIEIQKQGTEDNYKAFFQSGNVTIIVPHNDLNPASFTHELLHVNLYTKKILIVGTISNLIGDDEILLKIFSDDILWHINNCLEHIKMFPDFIQLGYNANDFLIDYTTNKLTGDTIALIKKQFSKEDLSDRIKGIKNYMGGFFAATSCFNKEFKYDDQLNELRKIDSELFIILQTLLNHWKIFNCDTNEEIGLSYRPFVIEFIDNMKEWTLSKSITI